MRSVSEEKKFSHIAVTPEDEDIVIEAGARTEASFAKRAESRGSVPGGDRDDAREAAEPQREACCGPTGVERASAADDDGYRATTLEDVEGVKMSLTQKIIIVLAVAGVAAFVVWYMFAG